MEGFLQRKYVSFVISRMNKQQFHLDGSVKFQLDCGFYCSSASVAAAHYGKTLYSPCVYE